MSFVINVSPRPKTWGDKFKAVDIIDGGLEVGLEAGLELERDLVRGILTGWK